MRRYSVMEVVSQIGQRFKVDPTEIKKVSRLPATRPSWRSADFSIFRFGSLSRR
jgi:hypothetical protein